MIKGLSLYLQIKIKSMKEKGTLNWRIISAMKDLSQPKIQTAAKEELKVYGEVHISRAYCKSFLL